MKLHQSLSKKYFNVKFIYIIIVIVILLFASLFGYIGVTNDSVDIVEAKIHVDEEIGRVLEPVHFFGNDSIGSISEYRWDFGDGNSSEEMNPIFTYELSGWFNVTLTVKGRSSQESNVTITMGIQRPDEEKTDSRGPVTDFRRNTAQGANVGYQTHGNIGNPRIEFDLFVSRPIGPIRLRISLSWADPSTGRQDRMFYDDSYFATGQDIDFQYIIEPDDFPIDGDINVAVVMLFYTLEDGSDGGVTLNSNIVYPVPNVD